MEALHYINSLDDRTMIDLKISKGVKSYCALKELQYFHMVQNKNVDLMHDVPEGLVPYFLANFFKYCSGNKIAYNFNVQKMCRDFNYGFLFKRKLPSLIKLTSSHLNQNAIQLYTVMIHLPFIFKDFRSELNEVIECISTTIYESDVVQLELLIGHFLRSYQEFFNTHLAPKFHFLTHYANTIREMGPVIFTWMMRFEAKHKVLPSFEKSECFKNIALTIAEGHQIMMCKDDQRLFEESKKLHFGNLQISASLRMLLEILKLYSLRLMNYNSFQYRKGLLLIENSNVYEILDICLFEQSYFFWFNLTFETVEFDSCLNSIQIKHKTSDNFEIVSHESLKKQQSYQKMNVFENVYVIADTLKVYRPHLMNKTRIFNNIHAFFIKWPK